MLTSAQLVGVDKDLANQVIAVAVSIAPCLDCMPEGSPLLERALSVLKAVAKHGGQRGSAMVADQRVGSAGVGYRSVATWFSDDDRNALRALCSGGAPAGLPVGRFPEAGVVTDAWPERGR